MSVDMADRGRRITAIRRSPGDTASVSPILLGGSASPRSARTRRPPRRRRRDPPSTWSGSGSSHRMTTRSTSWSAMIPARGCAPRSSVTPSRGRSRARTADGATTSSPRSNDAPRATRMPSAPGVGVRVAVRDEREGCTARGRPPPGRPGSDRGETRRAESPRRTNADVARPSPVLASTARVDPADELGVEPDSRVEGEPPPVHPAEPDRPGRRRSREGRAAPTGSRGSPSARGSTLVPPPGTNPSGISLVTPFSTSL